VFVREDAVISSLAPRYRGPYLVLDRQDKFFRLQIGSKQDVISVDRLKPVFSDTPVTPAIPPRRGRPRLKPKSLPSVPPPSSATKLPKKVRFKIVPQVLPPSIPVRRNPHRSSRSRRICSAIPPPFLLGGLLWRL
jgi:hypothetical protein